jgi:DNA-binding IclR family transcriptional regulator
MVNSKTVGVPSVERTISLLEFLAGTTKGATISELSRRLNVPKSSLHLLILTLERRGYLQKNSETNKYHFGTKLISLSRTALENLELREEAKPFLQALMQKTKLTVHMAILERNEAVIIEKIESHGLIQVATWIGRRMDLNCTGVGKALIAFLPEQTFDLQVKKMGLAKHNSKSIVSINKLKRDLEQVRRLGYALDDEEDEIGLRCIGAPVFSSEEVVVAAVSVAGTTSQIPLEKVRTIAKDVKYAAASISSNLGYTKC